MYIKAFHVKANFSLSGQELLKGRAIIQIQMSSLVSPKLGNFLQVHMILDRSVV